MDHDAMMNTTTQLMQVIPHELVTNFLQALTA